MDGRVIITDTETTGMSPKTGHRLVEVAALEMIDGVVTGNTFQRYINPLRDIPMDAQRIHGLTSEFLRDKPLFEHIVDDFLAFIGDAPLVAHNAAFDMRFFNYELGLAGRPALDDARVVDTLKIAKEKFPGAKASLDALAKRFGISNAERDLKSGKFHGALVDCLLLAEVYIELTGGRQRQLELQNASKARAEIAAEHAKREPRPHAPSPEEIARHRAFIAEKIEDPIWDFGRLPELP